MREDIFAIADAIEAEGQTPTQTAIRERLGRGSMSTIAPALKEWKATKAERAENINDAIPLAIFAAMDGATASIWAVALKEAEKIASVAREGQREAEKRAEGLAKELAEGRQMIEQLHERLASAEDADKARIKAEAERDAMRDRLAEAKGMLTEMRREERASRAREVKLTEKAATLEERAKAKR